MRILYFSPHPFLGLNDQAGYATHMRKVIEALRKEGHTVETFIVGGEKTIDKPSQITTKGKYFFIKRLLPAVIWETLKDLSLWRADISIQKQLEKRISEFLPDFVYERANYFQLSGVLACKNKKVTHIAEINSPYTEERVVLQGKSLLMKRARKREIEYLKLTSSLIVVSTALKEYFAKKLPICAEKIVVIPNAVDNSSLNEDFVLPKTISLPSEKIIIGFVGSIAPWHGIDRLIDAAEILSKKRSDFIFLIVGGGQNLQHYKQKSTQLGLDHCIIWVGSVEHRYVHSFIRKMEITVMPDSNWYGSPIKIFEYGLHSKAVIAPNYLPLKDVLQDGIDGLLIDKGPNDLSDAIIKLLDDSALRERLGRGFHNKIISNFTWQHVAAKITAIVKEIKNK